MRRKIAKIAAFIICITCVLISVIGVLRFEYEDGISNCELMYRQQEDSVDLMCFGTSRAFENINTQVLWDDNGSAAFVFAGSLQPLWNTYYYMKEAFKTQRPKVVIVDVYGVNLEPENLKRSTVIKNTYGLRPSLDKLRVLRENLQGVDFEDNLLEFPVYHGRYAELGRWDFVDDYGKANYLDSKGFIDNLSMCSFEKPKNSSTTISKSPTTRNEYWLNQIIKLAKDNSASLVFVTSPAPTASESVLARYNYVEELASQQGIPFYNGVIATDEMAVDYATDFTADGHLNWRGNVKYTRWLENILAAYNLPDRRGDARYSSWNIMAKDCRERSEDQETMMVDSLAARIDSVVEAESFSETLHVTAIAESISDQDAFAPVENALTKMGIHLDSPLTQRVFVTRGDQVLWSSDGTGGEWHSDDWPNPLSVDCADGQISITMNHTTYTAVKDAVTEFAYNEFTQKVVEKDSFPSVTNFQKASAL